MIGASGETTAITPRWHRPCYAEGVLFFTAPREDGVGDAAPSAPLTWTSELPSYDG